jgi:carbamoyltransferase
MITLGINGGLDLPYQNEFNFFSVDLHDAAAALVVDGKVVSAIEEERLNRIKHSNKSALFSSAKFVLEDYGISLNDVDKLCYYMTEDTCNRFLKHLAFSENFVPIRKRISEKINRIFNCDFDQRKLSFVHHHLAHAASTFLMSGFGESLILTIDMAGDGIAGMVLSGGYRNFQTLDTIPYETSLGKFYSDLITYLGFGHFDEYKVMGLAPHGNPGVYQDIFTTFYDLLPNGKFETHEKFFDVLNNIPGIPRQKDEPFTEAHKNIAASIQDALEKMIFHLLEYYKKKYNPKKLCLAGGVAQNCTVNGKILYSGMFDDVFVQPASTDAGTAVGAALIVNIQETKSKEFTPSRLEHVYWGTEIGSNDSILETLKCWTPFIQYEKIDNITETTAKLLADGAVVGWGQGKSEFGPRALGNRSILADPRPTKNKDIINAMVKKREAFRPFAPSVLEEYAGQYYEIPTHCKNKNFPFMTFILNVKKEKQEFLGAVTHVDGTARIQTVSKKTNEKFWKLLNEFRKITGIPILLNTSFNNNVEPIVNSVEDALACFLTTKLHCLVLGDYLIRKKEVEYREYLPMVPSFPLHVVLNHTRRPISKNVSQSIHEVRDNFLVTKNRGGGGIYMFPKLSFGVVKSMVSGDLYQVLTGVNGKKTWAELMNIQTNNHEEKLKSMVEEIKDLWALRLIEIKPKRNR